MLEKSANPQALERFPRFGEKKPDHSAFAPSRFPAKSPQILGIFQAHPGLRACLRKGKWRSKGNCESNRLWPLQCRPTQRLATSLPHCAAMLSSLCKPSNTIRTLCSAACCLLVARRLSRDSFRLAHGPVGRVISSSASLCSGLQRARDPQYLKSPLWSHRC